MIKCPGCGAGMRFDPKWQKLHCDYCETYQVVEGRSKIKEASGEVDASSLDNNSYQAMIYTCPDCGAEILSNDDTAVTFCSYCGNSVSLEGRLSKLKKPSRIIPFKKTFEEAAKGYKKYIKGAIFAPGALFSDASIDNFRGIYMPYWTYGYKLKSRVRVLAFDRHRKGDYVYTDNYEYTSDVDFEYDGISYDASSGFEDRFSNAIEPFEYDEAVDFDEAYMAGFYADAGDIEADSYKKKAQTILRHDLEHSITSADRFKYVTVCKDGITFTPKSEEKTESLSYFPVWFLANRYKNKVSYAVVNGQTGEVAADIPISYPKFLLGALLVALPIMLALNLFVTIRPSILLVLSVLFSLVSLILASSLADALYVRSNYFDDIGKQIIKFGNVQNLDIFKKTKKSGDNSQIGSIFAGVAFFILAAACIFTGYGDFLMVIYFIYMIIWRLISGSGNKRKKKQVVVTEKIVIHQPLGDKIKYLIKQIISMVLCGIVLLISPTYDYWYYGAAILSMMLTLISFYDLLSLHNKLSMRVPPQFNKRGGDL